MVRAERALDEGRPFQATLILDAAMATPADRTQARLLTAAKAAAAWEGWSTVGRLLAQARWLDEGSGGSGRELLARSALERGLNDAALTHASMALSLAGTGPERGPRLVLLARALDRVGRLDSAAAVYRQAGQALPEIRDWLLLRAAGVTADSAARAELYTGLTLPAARNRIPWTEALARDRTGDLSNASRLYEALGARLASIRIRLRGAPDSAATRRIRTELVGILTPGRSADDVRDAIDLLDSHFSPLSATEELLVARRAAVVNQLDRSQAGYARAGKHLRLSDRDRLSYGMVLFRLGRYDEAITRFNTIRSKELQPEAEYQRARALLRSGRLQSAIQGLEKVVEAFPNDSEWASAALFLTADLKVDRHQEDSARAGFLATAAAYGSTSYGQRARFQAALIAYLNQDYATAAREFGMLTESGAGGAEGTAGQYWAGRALAAQGDTAGARARWRVLVASNGSSYYVVPAAERLGVPAFSPFPTALSAPLVEDWRAGLGRATLLNQLGMKVEARFELDYLAATATETQGNVAAVAVALADAGLASRGVRLVQRALDRGAPLTEEMARGLYPLPARQALETAAREADLDPFLLAGLIRQESLFDAQARSTADARGLMQVLPSVGAGYAKRSGLSDWDPVLLYQPDVNLDFGVRHFQDAMRRYERVEMALAAYNAGTPRVDRWRELRGTKDDPEVFIERIPFVETRDYVRRILRNQAFYRFLYTKAPISSP